MVDSIAQLLRAAVVTTAALAAVGGLLVPVTRAESAESALTAEASSFDPGYIISDANFFDSDAMAAGEIQGFLEQRVPTCRSTSSVPCLKAYAQATPSMPASARCAAYTGSSSESAASIVARVGLACGINPQVLLVLLEKEQSLVSSTAPSRTRYDRATGFSCPDTAPCDPAFAGFFYQVYYAARQFQTYTQTPNSWNYRAGRVNNILFHPDAARCGSAPVYIANQATANLYIYTPYQPNAAALANLYGTGDACSSYGNRNFWRIFTDWFGSPTGRPSPWGSLDRVTTAFKSATFEGWLHDEDTADPVDLHVYVGGPYGTGAWGGSFKADVARPDVTAVYPAIGPNHGFRFTIALPPGVTTVCIYGINVGFGANALLSCPRASVPTGAPFGGLDLLTGSVGMATVVGWAIDPDTDQPIQVEAIVDGRVAATAVADRERGDVGRVHRGYGNRHGYEFDLPLSSGGLQRVCVQARDSASGAATLLGCREVRVPGGNPIGNFEGATAALGSARVVGWTLDPDVTGPIEFHVYANSAWAGAYRADASRPDVGAVYPAYGARHGFAVDVPLRSGGDVTICVYAINVGSGSTNPLLGCRLVRAPGGNPFGNLESVQAGFGTISIAGWIIDPDVNAPVELHVYVDGRWAGARRADLPRPDVGRAYAAYGADHGFSSEFVAAPGARRVCVYAINIGSGTFNPELGCRTVNVG